MNIKKIGLIFLSILLQRNIIASDKRFVGFDSDADFDFLYDEFTERSSVCGNGVRCAKKMKHSTNLKLSAETNENSNEDSSLENGNKEDLLGGTRGRIRQNQKVVKNDKNKNENDDDEVNHDPALEIYSIGVGKLRKKKEKKRNSLNLDLDDDDHKNKNEVIDRDRLDLHNQEDNGENVSRVTKSLKVMKLKEAIQNGQILENIGTENRNLETTKQKKEEDLGFDLGKDELVDQNEKSYTLSQNRSPYNQRRDNSYQEAPKKDQLSRAALNHKNFYQDPFDLLEKDE